MPSTPYDAKGLLLSAIFDDDPVIHLESIKLLRGIKGDVPLEDYRIPLGVAKIRREGTDITLVSCGSDIDQHIESLLPYVEAGFEEIYISNMGPNYADMIRTFGRDVLPALRNLA